MASKFEIKKSNSGQHFFNLKAGNGEIILTSETYTSIQNAQVGIASVKSNAPLDERYERKSSNSGQPCFVLKAANGQTLGKSEMYSSASTMENGISSVKRNAPSATVEDLSAQ